MIRFSGVARNGAYLKELAHWSGLPVRAFRQASKHASDSLGVIAPWDFIGPFGLIVSPPARAESSSAGSLSSRLSSHAFLL